jgi:hypothetical protein
MTEKPEYRVQSLARSAMIRALGIFAAFMALLCFIAAALGRATIENLFGAAIFAAAAYLLTKAANAIRTSSVID